jgi:GGDEF domain-containing protein
MLEREQSIARINPRFRADGTDPTELLKNADMALYRAKADGLAPTASSSPAWMPG